MVVVFRAVRAASALVRHADERWRNLFKRQDIFDGAGPDRRMRHPEVLGRRLVLGDDDAALFVDRLHAIGRVAVGAGQHDPDGTVPEYVGRRRKERVRR